MSVPTIEDLLKSGAHIGHLRRKKNAQSSGFVLQERSGIQIIDVRQTLRQLVKATDAMSELVSKGQKILFVATKAAAKELVKQMATDLEQPYVVARWLGGTLTNFGSIRQNIKKLSTLGQNIESSHYQHRTKKEQGALVRKKEKLETLFEGLAVINRLPAAVFVVDVVKEHTAVKEARGLNMPVFGLVDTNASPEGITHPIPANDDSKKSIKILLDYIWMRLALAAKMRSKQSAERAAATTSHAGGREGKRVRLTRKRISPTAPSKDQRSAAASAKPALQSPTSKGAKPGPSTGKIAPQAGASTPAKAGSAKAAGQKNSSAQASAAKAKSSTSKTADQVAKGAADAKKAESAKTVTKPDKKEAGSAKAGSAKAAGQKNASTQASSAKVSPAKAKSSVAKTADQAVKGAADAKKAESAKTAAKPTRKEAGAGKTADQKTASAKASAAKAADKVAQAADKTAAKK